MLSANALFVRFLRRGSAHWNILVIFNFSNILNYNKNIIEKDAKLLTEYFSTLFPNEPLARDREAIFHVVLSVSEKQTVLYTLVLLLEITENRNGQKKGKIYNP